MHLRNRGNAEATDGANDKDAEKADFGNIKFDPELELKSGGDTDEYTSLVRYINSYREARRRSTVTAQDYEEATKIPKWKFWKKSKVPGSGDVAFETPDEWLETNMATGLNSDDVEARRRHAGFNELTTEKENLFIKFLMYFTGPILYGKRRSLRDASLPPAAFLSPSSSFRGNAAPAAPNSALMHD
jgi:H+-transporting ATPase